MQFITKVLTFLHHKYHYFPNYCYVFSHFVGSLRIPTISSSLQRKQSVLSARVTLLPPYSGNKTVSPSFTLIGLTCPLSKCLPGPTAMTVPKFNYSCFDSGKRIPPLVLVKGSAFLTRTLFINGLNLLKANISFFQKY